MKTELKIVLDDQTKRELYEDMLVIANEAFIQATQHQKRIVNKEELKAILRCGEKQITDYITKHELKYFKQGRVIYFDLKDVYSMLENLKK